MGAPFAVTEPARISAFSRERDSSGRSTASTRSSRGDPSSPPTVTSSVCPSFGPLFEDVPCSKEEPLDDRYRCARTDPRAGRDVCAGAADDADRGPDLGARGCGVLIAVGYRLYRSEGSPAALTDITATLPKGARIVSTRVAGRPGGGAGGRTWA